VHGFKSNKFVGKGCISMDCHHDEPGIVNFVTLKTAIVAQVLIFGTIQWWIAGF